MMGAGEAWRAEEPVSGAYTWEDSTSSKMVRPDTEVGLWLYMWAHGAHGVSVALWKMEHGDMMLSTGTGRGSWSPGHRKKAAQRAGGLVQSEHSTQAPTGPAVSGSSSLWGRSAAPGA